MSRSFLSLAVVLTSVLHLGGRATAQTKPPAEFVGHTYTHRWTEGEFAGAAFDMTYLSDDMVRWKGIDGPPKGKSAAERYKYVQLAPKLHQFSFMSQEKPSAATEGAPPSPVVFELTSPDVVQGKLHNRHLLSAPYGFGCSGDNVSPRLSWQGTPAGTKSFVLMVHDLDAPTGIGWMHWVVVNIPATATELPQGVSPDGKGLPAGALQTRTDFGVPGYGGPCPPPGQPHRYVFTLFALKIERLPGVEAATMPALVAFHARDQMISTATITITQAR